MLVSYLCWFIALTLLSSEANGAHFLSNLCTVTKIGTYPYPGVYNVYFECEYGNATIYACPSGTNFDPIFMICSEKKVPYERDDCSENFYLPHPFNCKKYITCLNSEIKIFDCKTPFVYSIDTDRCEYPSRVPTCRRKLVDNNLRTDLNTHIHYSLNEIIGKKRDILHELADLDKVVDEDVDEELGEVNVASSQSSNELDKLTLENEIRDDDLSSSNQDSPNQITIHLANTIPRRKKKNYTKMAKNDELSIQQMNLILRLLGAPINIITKGKNKNETADQAFLESFRDLLEKFMLPYLGNQRNETSAKNISLPLETNISSPNINASESGSNGLITNPNAARKFPDDVEIVTQPPETLSSTSSFSEELEEKKPVSVTVSGEIQSTTVSSQKVDTSTLASSITTTVLNQVEDRVLDTTPTAEITDSTTVVEEHSDTSILPSAPFMSTSERAETTLRYSNNDETTGRVDSVVSQRMSTFFLSTTSSTVSDIANTDINSAVDERVGEMKSMQPKLLDSRAEIIDEVRSSTNIAATTELRGISPSVLLGIASSTTENYENTETLVASENVDVTTESDETDSTSVEYEYISSTNSQKSDEPLGTAEDVAVTIMKRTVSTSVRPEYISSIDNQNNDEIPVTPEHVSGLVESERNEGASTLSNDNLLINENTITNQKIPDVPNIQSEEAVSVLDIDAEIAQVEKSNEDKIRPSRFAESANFTETENDSPLVYMRHNKSSVITVSVARQRLRLNGTPKIHYGFVEIKGEDNIWRGVCQSTEWSIAEADIICRELGYQRGAFKAWKGHSHQVKMPAWTATSSIQCHGDEEWVDRCKFQDETECDYQRNAVGVECALN